MRCGGFIGLEMAENLKNKGIDVTLLQRSGQVMPPLDSDMAAIVHNYMRANGIHLKLNAPVESYKETSNGIQVNLKNQSHLKRI